MVDADKVALMIEELGALDDSILAVIQEEDGNWAARVDEVDVTLSLDEDGVRLRLATEIGTLPETDREKNFEALLIYNYAARQTGDVVMAVVGPGGPVVQTLSVPVADLTAKTLAVLVVNMAQRTLGMREVFEAGLPREESSLSNLSEFLIRV